MHPVILKSLCMHDYETGEPINDYDLSDYKEKWGHEYYMFHRQDMHKGLLKAATSEEGEGPPARLFVDHRAEHVDPESGRVKFTSGREIQADLVIGSDGIRSAVRQFIGVQCVSFHRFGCAGETPLTPTGASRQSRHPACTASGLPMQHSRRHSRSARPAQLCCALRHRLLGRFPTRRAEPVQQDRPDWLSGRNHPQLLRLYAGECLLTPSAIRRARR